MRIRLDIPLYTEEIINAVSLPKAEKNAKKIEYITTDSREVERGDLFVALNGPYESGERYVSEAKSKGAVCLSRQAGSGIITVSDTLLSLQNIANYYKKKLPKLKYTAGVTGSVGKTTTKDFFKTIASGQYNTHATYKNFNNHIGVPLTILSADKDTELLILEMGMNHRGEISALSKCACPDIGIITNIGTAHIGNLGSRERIAEAKLEIKDGMSSPHLIIPYGEPLLSCVTHKTTFAVNNSLADIYIIYNEEKIILKSGTESYELSFGPRGQHMAECLCAATAAATRLGINLCDIVRQISSIQDEIPRQTINSVKHFYILPDYYNASFESVSAALKLLSSMKKYKRRSALLGTVKELGEKGEEIHKKIGRCAATSGIQSLFLFGEFSDYMCEGALEAGMTPDRIFINSNESDPEKTANQIIKFSLPGELILFKASNATGLCRIVDLLRHK